MKYNKTTNHPHNTPPILIIITVIFFICFFTIPLIDAIAMVSKTSTSFSPTDDPIGTFFQCLSIFTVILMLFLVFAIPAGLLIGKLRAKRKIHHDNQAIQLANPYQYYKELPNHYGIGIATLLTDSTIENEKDIVAAILDLCAQGYLHLSKHSDHYVIRILPFAHEPALRNERYILDLIRQNQLHQISYRHWYKLCVEDGIALDLYNQTKLPDFDIRSKTKRITASAEKNQKKLLIASIIFALLFAVVGIPLTINIPNGHNLVGVIVIIALGIIFVPQWLYGMIHTILSMTSIAQSASHTSYKLTLENHLTKTAKGVEELQKLLAFRNFLAQFNTFVNKDPEAVILWDRYLSYAQVFGLSKELMRSGYSQLIDNAAFKIDNIDSITLDNLSLSSSSSLSHQQNSQP